MAIHTSADPEVIPGSYPGGGTSASKSDAIINSFRSMPDTGSVVQSYYIAAGNEGFILKVKNWESQ